MDHGGRMGSNSKPTGMDYSQAARLFPLQPRVLDINQCLEEIKGAMKQMVPKNIKVTFEPSFSSFKIKVDTFSLDQIIMSLLSVATLRMPSGGSIIMDTGSIILDMDDAEYAKDYENMIESNHVVLSLRDTGPWLTPEDGAQIFETTSESPSVVQQESEVHNEIKTLSDTWGLVKQNGGYMDIQNRLDSGCIFRIYFPQFAEETPIKSIWNEKKKGETQKIFERITKPYSL